MPVYPSKCPSCGGSNLEPGKLSDLVHFIPENRRFFTLHGIKVYATACCDCGYLQLMVNKADMAKVLPRTRPDPRRGFPVQPTQAAPRPASPQRPLEPPDNLQT